MNNDEDEPKNSPPCLGGVRLQPRGGSSDDPDRLHNSLKLRTFRTTLRKHLTPAEARLWKYLQRSKLDGRKFRRQHSVGPYILDFLCVSERLGIELDGEVHFNDWAREYDYERKLFLEHYGIKVIRFENYLVFQEIDFVLDRISGNFGWWERD